MSRWVMIFVCLTLPVSCSTADDPPEVPLWPDAAPGSEGITTGNVVVDQGKNGSVDRRVTQVHNPSLTVFLPPKDKATGAAVVICPGGGHRVLAIDHEGYDVAKWLNSIGVAGFVLKYRLARAEGSNYKIEEHALEDAKRAVRLVRSHASEWGIDPGPGGHDRFLGGRRNRPRWRARASTGAPRERATRSIG